MQHAHYHYKRASKFRSLGYLAFALIGMAILNVVRSYHIAMCDVLSVCEVEAPLLFLMIPALMVVAGLGLFVHQAYRDFIRHDYLEEDPWE
ncbi:hypothetical protein [Undibacterium sp.]|uniref:hypothetical protein n=1 Tax=Undibacterium sp. TaxID=1914977 RepID=UPI00374D3FB1